MKKFLALLLALVMVMGLATTASAAEITKASGVSGPASITVNLPANNNGATANNTYKIYKVFDATVSGTNNISYTLVAGKTDAPAGFTVTNGYVTYAGTGSELTTADLNALAAYVTDAMLVATVDTTAADTSFTVTGLPYGYYYITTTTGTAVSVDSTNKNATVSDKNVVPTVNKNITGASNISDEGKMALAQIGTKVTFTGTVTVGFGVENYVYHDTMTDGLSFNNDIVVKEGDKTVDASKYSVNTNPANDETFTVAFNNDYIETLAKGTEIKIIYTATITADAVNGEQNEAYLSYGNDDDTDTTPVIETQVYNAKFTVTKHDNANKPLAGAGFVIKNAEGDYYKLANGVVTWVDSIDDATEYKSNANGEVTAFTGLANGTYTLIEKTVPTGYNKAADFDFTVKSGDYSTTNLVQSTTVINNAGTELPTTGGMGTTMFYIFGFTMMMAAVVLLVTKKRMADAV